MALPKVLAAAGAGILGASLIDRRTNIVSDIRQLRLITTALKEVTARAESGRSSVVEMFLEAVDAVPNKECMVWSSGGRAKSSWTFREVDESEF